MKSSDRTILVALPLLALAVGFWLLVLGPKQREAGDLGERADNLRESIAAAEAEVATAEEARRSFPRDYARLVSLGAAVPEDDDQATFVHDLSELARRDSVSFRSFELTPGTSAVAPPAPAAPPAAPPAAEIPASGSVTTTGAPATEASAATLPLGATVGPAGLPVMPYSLSFFGRFFDMADLFASLDSRVDVGEGAGSPRVKGRLMTIDSFAMSADPVRGFPRVKTDLLVTTYLVPAEQGIAAGATPGGPAPAGAVPVEAPVAPEAGVPAPGATAAVAP